MGVKIKDYMLAINKQKQEAIMNGKKSLIIRAGELHSQYGEKGSPTLIQCCSAMKQSMLIGDEIIFDKENKTGASAALTINYNLENIDSREKLDKVKKRGRPFGSKNKHLEKKTDKTAEDVNSSIENWMRKEKLRYESQDDMFIIYDSYGKWVIPKYRYEHVTDNFFFALKTMKHKFYKCTVIFRDTKEAHELWDSLPEEVIERLNLSVLLVAENGTVTQLIY